MIEIRDERPGDMDMIWEVNRQAFDQEQEGRIVDALRKQGGALLSLVAVANGIVVGHIMFSPLTVGPKIGAGLGPMAVLPAYQRQGIGTHLVNRGLARLKDNGCPFVVVIGHPDFYPRFGFQAAAAYGLTCEWDVPAEVFMVAVLKPEFTGSLAGLAKYRSEFSTVE
jgi:putative acetyltransferase